MSLRRSILSCLALAGGALAIFAAPHAGHAQEVFHSTQSANLPTAETLRAGNWMFEISHRFQPISTGSTGLWGLDGPINNRLGLSFAPTDRVVLGVLRTNAEDNLELNAKGTFFQAGSESVLLKVGAMGGVAWNTGAIVTEGAEDNEAQYYGQLIANVLLGERVAVGVVPTYLRNPRIRDVSAENSFVLGLHAQTWLSRSISVIGEWIISEQRVDMETDSGTLGFEIETRGHFFKLVVTNQGRMNPTQVLGGTPNSFSGDDVRLGFNITRLLPF